MAKTRGRPPQRTQGGRAPGRGPRLLWLCAILVLTFVAYVPSLGNDFTTWDDNVYVTENPLVQHPDLRAILTTPVAGNYHPLTMASLALNYRISGLNPSSYHWLNLLLHIANTALVFFFIWKLSQGRFWTTVVVSLLFGIHPMHVESVAWIAERKDVLYAFFYLLGLIAYLEFLERRQLPWLGAAWLAFVLSVASKPSAIVFPIALLAIDYLRRRPIGTAVLLEKAPFFLVSIAGGILTLKAQQSLGAMAYQWGPFKKLQLAAHGIVMYVVKLFAPVQLSAIYPYPSAASRWLAPKYAWSLAAVAVLVPLAVYLFRRVRVALFGIAFFLIHVVLVLQFLTVGGAVFADRYTYLPYIGLTLMLAWWLDERSAGAAARLPLRPVLAAVVLLLVPVSVYGTWERCRVWKDTSTLWDDTIRKYPNGSADAYINRAAYRYRYEKRLVDAVSDYDHALAMNPGLPRIWVTKGNILAELGRNDSALACYDRALAIQPGFAEALNNRGGVEFRTGNLARSLADLTKAIELDPGYRDAYANRAAAYATAGEYEKAMADSRRALDLDPKRPENHALFDAIGVYLQKLNRPREALAAHDEAIRTVPADDPRRAGYFLNRSFAWRSVGDLERARSDVREAVRLGARVDPGYLKQLGG